MNDIILFLLFDCKSLISVSFSIQRTQIPQPGGLFGMSYKEEIRYDPYPGKGKNQCTKYNSIKEFTIYYRKKHDSVRYTILLGSNDETNILFHEISGSNDIIFCYDPEVSRQQNTGNTLRETKPQPAEIDLKQLLNDITTSLNNSQNIHFQTIERSIVELKAAISALQQNRATPVVSSRNSCNANELKETIDKMADDLRKTHYFANELYNSISTNSIGNGNEGRIEELKNELGTYKNDFYLKVSLPHVMKAIEMLCIMYEELDNIRKTEGANSSSFERMRHVISASEGIVKRSKDVQIRISNSGDNWDPHSMRAFDDRVVTEQEELKGHVAYSISPAFFWVLPRVNALGAEDSLLIKEETVALYE